MGTNVYRRDVDSPHWNHQEVPSNSVVSRFWPLQLESRSTFSGEQLQIRIESSRQLSRKSPRRINGNLPKSRDEDRSLTLRLMGGDVGRVSRWQGQSRCVVIRKTSQGEPGEREMMEGAQGKTNTTGQISDNHGRKILFSSWFYSTPSPILIQQQWNGRKR